MGADGARNIRRPFAADGQHRAAVDPEGFACGVGAGGVVSEEVPVRRVAVQQVPETGGLLGEDLGRVRQALAHVEPPGGHRGLGIRLVAQP